MLSLISYSLLNKRVIV